MSVAPGDLPAHWRARAEELRPYSAPAAESWSRAAEELEAALEAEGGEELTLTAAAKESGYAARTIREKIARGEILNVGKRHRPRVRRADLPRRGKGRNGDGFDAAEHVGAIVARSS